MLKAFENNLMKYNLLKKGDCVVLAVSGGIDSMTLLHLFKRLSKKWELELQVAHVNHKLRGKASDMDEDFVVRESKRAGLNVTTAKWKKGADGNIQDMARKFRYSFLKSLAREVGASAVATAHTRDDQAETVLFHIVRGSSLKGLAGIPIFTFETPNIIRPMLSLTRRQIEAYAKKNRLVYRTDSSNKKTKYTRNFIRHKVMPILKILNPRVEEALSDISQAAACSDEALSIIASAFGKEYFHKRNGRILWQRKEFRELPQAIRRLVLIKAYETLKGTRANLNSDQITKMEDITVKTKGFYMLPKGARFHCEGKNIFIEDVEL